MNVSALNETVVLTREIKVAKDLAHVTAFVTGASQLGSWLSPVKSVDPKVGGRIEFRAEAGFEHGGTYEVLDLPHRVVIVTDKFGVVEANFSEANGKTIVHFTFSKSGDDEYEKIIADTVTRFIAMVNY
jgi:hypothetical protein